MSKVNGVTIDKNGKYDSIANLISNMTYINLKLSAEVVEETPQKANGRMLHIATGGTIDAYWEPNKDTAVSGKTSVVEDYLRNVVRLKEGFRHNNLMQKDSREITWADRGLIISNAIEAPEQDLMITAGTYLMTDIARDIGANPFLSSNSSKRIILTGALKPMRGFLRSDAGFNLGMSVGLFQTDMAPGSYVVMNGSCFKGETVSKDLSSATFNSIPGVDLIPFQSFTYIAAGGTFDFQLNGLDGLAPTEFSAVPNYLRDDVKINHFFNAATPFVLDSRKLNEDHLKEIINIINFTNDDHIVITCGLYRIKMIQEYIQNSLSPDVLKSKKIVLTAARLPLSVTDITDATFNLGYSFAKLGFVQPGVHIALNGQMMTNMSQENILREIFTPSELTQLVNEKVL